MDSLPAFSPKERVAMGKVTRRTIRLAALLVVLALLAFLAVNRNGLTTKETEDEVVGDAVKVVDTGVRDEFAAVAIIGLVALFAFVTWAALRANDGEDRTMPPPGSGAVNDRTHVR
jgi:uncharacterized membrane protein